MRTGIQDVHCEEDQAEIMFSDSESPEEPIGNQGIYQKAAAKCIERKRAVIFAMIRLLSELILGLIRADSDESAISTAGERSEYRAATIRQSPETEKYYSVRTEHRDGEVMLQKDRQASSQCSKRSSCIEKDVVPSQLPRSLDIWDQSRNDGLVKSKGGGTICAGAIQHTDERHCQQQRQTGRQRQGESAHSA